MSIIGRVLDECDLVVCFVILLVCMTGVLTGEVLLYTKTDILNCVGVSFFLMRVDNFFSYGVSKKGKFKMHRFFLFIADVH